MHEASVHWEVDETTVKVWGHHPFEETYLSELPSWGINSSPFVVLNAQSSPWWVISHITLTNCADSRNYFLLLQTLRSAYYRCTHISFLQMSGIWPTVLPLRPMADITNQSPDSFLPSPHCCLRNPLWAAIINQLELTFEMKPVRPPLLPLSYRNVFQSGRKLNIYKVSEVLATGPLAWIYCLMHVSAQCSLNAWMNEWKMLVLLFS